MITPDTKDWTWVLDVPCPECGFDAAAVDVRAVAGEIRRNSEGWRAVLAGPGATVRPAPGVWSPTEYAAHVRDVHAVFAERVRLMLDQDAPTFANWDQDATALKARYDLERPDDVSEQLLAAASDVADLYDAVPDAALERPWLRSNGSAFTIASIARYHLHDVVHHLGDVAYRCQA